MKTDDKTDDKNGVFNKHFFFYKAKLSLYIAVMMGEWRLTKITKITPKLVEISMVP
jgi:hypothetical protein